jgi:small-conductance mechanosensitive channel
MATLEERIQSRIDQLKEELKDVITSANKTIAAYQASISELEALLQPVQEMPADELKTEDHL